MTEQAADKLPLHVVAGRVWRLLLPEDRRRLFGLFALMLGAAAVEMISLAAIQLYMQVVAAGDPASVAPVAKLIGGFAATAQIAILTAGLGLVLLFKLATMALVYAALARTVARQRVVLSERLFKAYQYAPYLWHMTRNASQLQRNLRDDTTRVVRGIILQLLQFALNLIIAVGVLAFIVISLPLVGLIGLALAAVLLLAIARVMNRVLSQAGRVQRTENQRTIAAILQGFGSLTEARILGRRAWFFANFQKTLKRGARAQGKTIFVMQTAPYFVETAIMFALMIIVAAVVVTSDSLESALAVVTVTAAAMFRLKQAAAKLTNAVNKISEASPSLTPLLNDLDTLAEPADSDIVPTSRNDKNVPFAEVLFEKAGFSFPGQDTPVLSGIDLGFRHGQHLAIVGPTGSGKSTLIGLILGLLSPTSGRILVDGQDLKGHEAGWRAGIGYVPQSVYVLQGTIAQNVAFGIDAGDIDEDRVRAVLRAAQLARAVDAMPGGIDAPTGEHGANLSGGQRQRLGIARALYHAPQVLILDEATSALDRSTQESVLAALADLPGKPTIISVTHQMETLRHSDTVVFLKDRRIHMKGRYEELVEKSPEFREMALIDTESAQE